MSAAPGGHAACHVYHHDETIRKSFLSFLLCSKILTRRKYYLDLDPWMCKAIARVDVIKVGECEYVVGGRPTASSLGAGLLFKQARLQLVHDLPKRNRRRTDGIIS